MKFLKSEPNKLLLIFMLLFWNSCSLMPSPTPIDIFIQEFERKFTQNDLRKFKDGPIDSAMLYFDMYYHEYTEVYETELKDNTEILNYFDELQITKIGIPGYVFLMYEFHARKNKKSYTIVEYKEIWDRLKKNEEIKKDALNKKHEKELQAIIHDNDERHQVNDTLNVIIPLFNNSTVLRLYPYSLDIPDFNDTLKIEAILIDKLQDSLDVIFKLKLLKLSNDQVYILGDKRKIGDIINLSMEEYGRLIEK